MHEPIEMQVDVTEAAGLGIDAHTAVTVFLPDVVSDPPVVCFAFPGGGYSRRYFSFDMPDSSGGGEAGFHTSRGWIFVACDHLGVGDSTVPEGTALDFDNVARANGAMVGTVMGKIEDGSLQPGFPPVSGATKLGVGQSMGGCFTIVLQGQHRPFDGVGALGFSAIHTVVPTRPGTAPAAWPWIPRNSDLQNPTILNQAALAAAAGPTLSGTESLAEAAATREHPFAWAFHYDDVPSDIVGADMAGSVVTNGAPIPDWRSATTPPCAAYMVAPGAVALEAASITVPVLVAVGSRDVVPDAWAEPKAFKSATDITVFVCPRMGHMHNFAGSRHQFWQRIHTWGAGVAQARPARIASGTGSSSA